MIYTNNCIAIIAIIFDYFTYKYECKKYECYWKKLLLRKNLIFWQIKHKSLPFFPTNKDKSTQEL
jgi:hypothetical protein